MGACIVNGIGAGPAETIMPSVIADIFFLHDRGKWNTLYWVVYVRRFMLKISLSMLTASLADGLLDGWTNHLWCNDRDRRMERLLVAQYWPAGPLIPYGCLHVP